MLWTNGNSSAARLSFEQTQRPLRPVGEWFMDIFAPSHLLILLLIILVIFGPAKLGDVGGALGRAIRDFKKAMNDPEQTPEAGRAVSTTAPTVASASETTVVDTKADKSAQHPLS